MSRKPSGKTPTKISSVRLPELHKIALECIAEIRGVSGAAVIRSAIEEYCREEGFSVDTSPERYREIKIAKERYEGQIAAARLELQKAVKGEK